MKKRIERHETYEYTKAEFLRLLGLPQIQSTKFDVDVNPVTHKVRVKIISTEGKKKRQIAKYS